jgi:outer membrane protein
MKRTFLSLAAGSLLLLVGLPYAAAQQKIGYINTSEVLQLMPERDSASKLYEKFNGEISKEFESMNVLYNNLLETYTKQKDSLSTFIRQSKEAELMEMNGKIANFREVAQQELDKKQNELMAPIIEKLRKAIKEVAEANKYTYIMDISGGALVYYPEDETLNVLPLVKAKLGIK